MHLNLKHVMQHFLKKPTRDQDSGWSQDSTESVKFNATFVRTRNRDLQETPVKREWSLLVKIKKIEAPIVVHKSFGRIKKNYLQNHR